MNKRKEEDSSKSNFTLSIYSATIRVQYCVKTVARTNMKLTKLLLIFIFSFVVSFIGDNGNLVSEKHKPKSSAAYFTGPGLDSTNKA